ncbi:hypothetical protein [Duganella sp. Root1480D1]|uniref:hypothetical protein n=1 Tax=Duganella sp. Root1480D1 TaxID=1736471 RepID=UPI0012E39E27|nr:hypothetical protein [Duganella sp. Root1480D1]
MNTEDILRQIVEHEYPSASVFDDALSVCGRSRNAFSENFAKEVAQRYLHGTIAFDVADCAINALSAWTPLEDFSACCWAIYLAFDEGEYLHRGQAAGTNEELFTRPLLIKAKSDFFPDANG